MITMCLLSFFNLHAAIPEPLFSISSERRYTDTIVEIAVIITHIRSIASYTRVNSPVLPGNSRQVFICFHIYAVLLLAIYQFSFI